MTASVNSATTGGGDVSGGIYQAGRDVVVHPPSPPPSAAERQATYEAVPKWRSPFTQAVLGWIALVLGVVSIFPFWKMIQPLVDVGNGDSSGLLNGSSYVWTWVVAVVILLLAVTLSLRRIATRQTRHPLVRGWAISGLDNRVVVEKIRTDRCPRCGGKMQYYSKPTEWIDHAESNGRRWREVTERVPALECRRNSTHWFEVDPAEDAL